MTNPYVHMTVKECHTLAKARGDQIEMHIMDGFDNPVYNKSESRTGWFKNSSNKIYYLVRKSDRIVTCMGVIG